MLPLVQLPLAILTGLTVLSGCGGPIVASSAPEARVEALRQAGPADLPMAVEALDAADILVRTAAIRALERMTGERLGYDPGAPRTDRTEAIERWVRYVNDSAMTTAHADGEA